MGEEGLRYDELVEDALRSVVRRALDYAAERGLPGDHHFYITFRTGHPGVDIPEHLRARYPNEMTVVLQYQFWGLDVGEDAFGVTLSFADVPERLTIPFAAVTAFADPSVRFGLQFDSSDEDQEGTPVTAAPASEQQIGRPPTARDREEPTQASEAAGPRPKRDRQEDAREPAQTGEVITLDAFRKK
ncbi:MAG: SspB family protein [Kiloniellaceae bacterium]